MENENVHINPISRLPRRGFYLPLYARILTKIDAKRVMKYFTNRAKASAKIKQSEKNQSHLLLISINKW